MEGRRASGGSGAVGCEHGIMMNGGMAAMMGGMGLVWLLVIVVLVLGVAALVKYQSGR
jgi:hypothetical protein